MKWINAETPPNVEAGRRKQFIALWLSRDNAASPITRPAWYLNQYGGGEMGDDGGDEGTGWFRFEYDEYYAIQSKVIAYAEIPDGPTALAQFRGGPW